WYWMPDVFDQFFARFGRKAADYYQLERLDPSYRIYFGPGDHLDVPAGMAELEAMFEQLEPGSTASLRKFLQEAAYKYQVGMNEFVHKPGHGLLEFADWRVISSMFRIQMFTSLSKHVKSLFRNERLIKLLEFPVLFLGATPEKTPALYSLMNYADLALGTWYPRGGMYRIVEAMTQLAQTLGVKIVLNTEVAHIRTEKSRTTGVVAKNGTIYPADAVVGSADYHHVESELLAPEVRNYSSSYWKSRVMAPSCLIFYVGVSKRLNRLLHHNLFFDEDFGRHAREIYETPQWPERPLFYVSAPSRTDPTVAPEGCENLFILLPVAPGLEDTPAIREHYYNLVMQRLSLLTGERIGESVVYRRAYAHSDFVRDYHAFKGNAYGLANTLRQTAFLKPKLRNKKIPNLYYTGQLTVPGPGVPPAIISGQVVAREVALALAG
ncbi:MAG TPA: phytoene desaturase family protein, partial [Saprospiraceae bacterium]|nr:phytoene desaturase family protein [Saprospiraceae bacterium]